MKTLIIIGRIDSRSPTTERYHEVTPRRRRFSPSSDDVIGGKRTLTRPRSLVLDNVESNVEMSLEPNVARPIKKYKSVVVLRETPGSQRNPISSETNRYLQNGPIEVF